MIDEAIHYIHSKNDWEIDKVVVSKKFFHVRSTAKWSNFTNYIFNWVSSTTNYSRICDSGNYRCSFVPPLETYWQSCKGLLWVVLDVSQPGTYGGLWDPVEQDTTDNPRDEEVLNVWLFKSHRIHGSGIFTMKHMKLVVDYVTLSFPISCQRILCDGLEPLTCMIGVQRSKYGCSKLITINHILGNLGKEKNISSSYTCMSKDGVWQIIGFNSCLNNLTRNTWPKDLGALNLWKNISQLILETGDSEKEVVCQRPGFSNADHEMKQNPQVHLYSCCSSIYVWFN